MEIRIWNAYASNNSGSYTIIGRLPSAEVAQRTAVELRAMIDAHTTWRDAWDGKSSLEQSPLAEFCRTHALTWTDGQGGWDDWPSYNKDNRPRVEVSGSQLIVHHEYTVGLPATFGEMIYKQGGRVEHEECHAHDPMVVTGTFWWGWTPERRAIQEAELPRLLAALTSADGLLAQPNGRDLPPAWREGQGRFGEAPLTIVAIFDDLLAGVAALRAVAEAHSAELELRLSEAALVDDPLLHFRPSTPVVPRFDVVLLDVGATPANVAAALAEGCGFYASEAQQRTQRKPPFVGARSLVEVRAQRLATALEAAGARCELRRNDA